MKIREQYDQKNHVVPDTSIMNLPPEGKSVHDYLRNSQELI